MKRNVLIPIRINILQLIHWPKEQRQICKQLQTNTKTKIQSEEHYPTSGLACKRKKKVLKSKLQRKLPEMCLNKHTWAIPR